MLTIDDEIKDALLGTKIGILIMKNTSSCSLGVFEIYKSKYINLYSLESSLRQLIIVHVELDFGNGFLQLEAANPVVGDRPIYNFSVITGNKTISQFDGNITVSGPYTPKAGEDRNSIVIYYINAEGKAQIVSNCVYDPATKTIRYTANHFSQYAVGYQSKFHGCTCNCMV